MLHQAEGPFRTQFLSHPLASTASQNKKDQRLLFGVARIKAALEAHCCASACRTGDALVDTVVFFDTGLVASLEGGQGFGKNEREKILFRLMLAL